MTNSKNNNRAIFEAINMVSIGFLFLGGISPVLNILAKSYFWIINGEWIDFPISILLQKLFGLGMFFSPFNGEYIGINKLYSFIISQEAWAFVSLFSLILFYLLLKISDKYYKKNWE